MAAAGMRLIPLDSGNAMLRVSGVITGLFTGENGYCVCELLPDENSLI